MRLHAPFHDVQEGGENLPSLLLGGSPASPMFCGRLPGRPPRAFDARRQSIAIARTFDAAAAGVVPSMLSVAPSRRCHTSSVSDSRQAVERLAVEILVPLSCQHTGSSFFLTTAQNNTCLFNQPVLPKTRL